MTLLSFQQTPIQLVRIILISFVINHQVNADATSVEDIVKNSPCSDGKTIEEALKDKINMRSQRDLGWQVFNENGQNEVERAFLMNKSMQLRFRWLVNPDGSIKPISSRAEALCTKE